MAEHANAYAWDKIAARSCDLNAGVRTVLDEIDASRWLSPDKPTQRGRRHAIAAALTSARPVPTPPERFILRTRMRRSSIPGPQAQRAVRRGGARWLHASTGGR